MGQGFSLSTLSAGSAVLDAPELADLVYEKSMGSARFMKSIRARHTDGVVLVKMVAKPYSMTLESYRKEIVRERQALADVPNALAYQRIVETETSGLLVRQYLYSSLYDRMSTRPFLEEVEKKWLAFQLLCALRDCHARDVFHGDIKTENTLVTSWNWLYLSDFSAAFKPTALPEDNPADFSYFFDTAGRRTCYLAPERFVAAGTEPDARAKVTWAMDVFSAGCVIAELFLEAPIFNLSQLYKYRKGEYDPVTSHLNRIADREVREMVAHMVQIEPEKRYSAEEYLGFWRNKVFPDYFFSFLHQYMGLITDPSSGRAPISGALTNLGEADERIDRIYYDFDKISYFLGYENEKQQHFKPILSKASLDIIPVHLDIPNNEHQASLGVRRPADDGTLIFCSLVVTSLRNTARSAARIKACDVLLAFAERLTDEAKLDRILPYLVSLLTDKADIVKVAAVRTITQLMALVTVISPVNAHVFPEYVLPRMQNYVLASGSTSRPIVRATYAACLGSLATSAARFLDMVATLKADGTLPTSDPEAEDGGGNDAAFHGLFDNSRSELVDIFEMHTKALITDSDSAVRRAFLGSVPELCMFFGTADANDIILSHLNTYLNDRNWMLKCAFFEKIVGVATFLGGTSLEEFILPLMVQALTDPEEFVVERVLRSLASLAELGMFQRSKTWDLVEIVARFTMHPNIWIREAAAMFLSSATIFLSPSDTQCIILPLLKPYLKTSITNFSELNLLDALKKPLTRPVLDLAASWAVKVDRGIFWKPVYQSRTFAFGSQSQSIPPAVKDIGPNALARVSKNDEDEHWLTRLRNIGMGIDDEWKFLILREYIWQMAPLRARDMAISPPTYLQDVINIRNLGINPQTIMFDDRQLMDEPLRQMRSAESSPVEERAPHTIADALLDASMTIDDSLARRRRSAMTNHRARFNDSSLAPMTTNGGTTHGHSSLSPSPTAPSLKETAGLAMDPEARRVSSAKPKNGSDDDASSVASSIQNAKNAAIGIKHRSSALNLLSRGETFKSTPETGTTSANAFGKVEGPFMQMGAISPISMTIANIDEPQKKVRFQSAHTYSGNDPSVLKMLDSVYVDKYPNDMVEFGPLVTPLSRKKSIGRSNTNASEKPWRPEGILVATFAEHVGPVRRVIVAIDHVFFITGGDDGCVKIWDTARLERNIAHRSRQTHRHAPGAKITSLCFVENTHCFVSCASDGSINVVKVDYIYGGGVSRYGKLKVLREHQLPPDECAVWSEHFKFETHSLLMLATNRSRVLAVDLRSMKTLYVLENPVHHGTPTCFVVDRKRHWLLLGTSHGVLDLWDLRFRVRLKAWGVPHSAAATTAATTTAIHRVVLHPFKGRGRWVCVAGGGGEVTVWDIEKTQCREVFRAGGSGGGRDHSSSSSSPKGYEPWAVDEDRPEGMLGRFATALDSGGSNNINNNNNNGSSSSNRNNGSSSVGRGADCGIRAMVAGTEAREDGRDSRNGFLLTGGADRRLRFWDLWRVEGSGVVSGLEVDEQQPSFTASQPSATLTLNTERWPRPGPTAPNAGAGGGRSDAKSGGAAAATAAASKPPRSTVISLQQQNLLKSHLDSILDVALLESPYGMTVSVDRSGITYVFQ